jgi:CheY-like chemotaxis protein
VDDDPLAARWAVRLLPRWRVEVFSTSAEALHQCHRFDAFLVDVCLSLEDTRGGIALAKELRERLPRAAIVLMSGLWEGMDAEAARVDADGGLLKPRIVRRELRELLLRALERRSGHRPAAPVPEDLLPLRALVEDSLDAIALEEAAAAERACSIASLASAAQPLTSRGRGTMRAVARVVGLTRQQFHAYASVGRRWTSQALRELLCRRNSNGEPISVSHLAAVAPLAKVRRETVLKAMLEESLTVAEAKRLRRQTP